MEECKYWMEGTFTLSDDKKKKEMNALILEVLRKTGIRKKTFLELDGERIPTVMPPKQDKDGIVRFDYSIFEKDSREGNYYNLETCELVTPDRGYNEFGLSMNLIMTILESYSETPYFLMEKEQLCYISGYAMIVESLTGVILNFESRSKIFDVWAYFKKKGKESEMTILDLISSYPYSYGSINQVQFSMLLLNSPIRESAKVEEKSFYDVIENFEYQSVKKMKGDWNNKRKYWEYIVYLLDLDLEARKKEAQRNDELAFLAKGSIKVPSPFLVKIYAQAYGQDFAELWLSANKAGYWDIDYDCDDEKKSRKVADKHLFFRCIMRENEDEFIEFWENDNLLLSDEMQSEINDWKLQYHSFQKEDYSGMDVEKTLSSLVHDLYDIWGCKLIDQNLLDEILCHKEEMEYKRAVYLLKYMIEDEISYFGELTDAQVREWLLRRIHPKIFEKIYSGYMDLLNNKKHRKDILGF